MMYPDQAQGIANCVSADCAQRIEALLRYGETFPPPRMFVAEVRDKLHQACTMFEDGRDAEHFEMWYLPLFDALSNVTHAARYHPPLQRQMLAALKILQRLHREAGGS